MVQEGTSTNADELRRQKNLFEYVPHPQLKIVSVEPLPEL
jgi:hypothetical protein